MTAQHPVAAVARSPEHGRGFTYDFEHAAMCVRDQTGVGEIVKVIDERFAHMVWSGNGAGALVSIGHGEFHSGRLRGAKQGAM